MLAICIKQFKQLDGFINIGDVVELISEVYDKDVLVYPKQQTFKTKQDAKNYDFNRVIINNPFRKSSINGLKKVEYTTISEAIYHLKGSYKNTLVKINNSYYNLINMIGYIPLEQIFRKYE